MSEFLGLIADIGGTNARFALCSADGEISAPMTLHGGGGTDFRPVFRYIDGLIEAGEFAHLQGILYFTDGYGVFPDAPPAYRAIFVMLQYRYDDIDLPPWAEKLVLEAEKPKGDEAWI